MLYPILQSWFKGPKPYSCHEIFPAAFPDSFQYIQREFFPALSVDIFPVIDITVKKLADKIAVAAVQLNSIQACLFGPPRCLHKIINHFPHTLRRHLAASCPQLPIAVPETVIAGAVGIFLDSRHSCVM